MTERSSGHGSGPAMDPADAAADEVKRVTVIATCLAMQASGINQGTSGNVSVRDGNGLLITPSGVPYERLTPGDIVAMGLDGSFEGDLAPSSEWHFHCDIMAARADVHAIVHAHPTYATTLAIRGMEIPAVHYMIAACGGPTVRCAPYATYGTEDLSKNALAALEGRTACLLANHGLIACGPSLENALWLAIEVETLAKQYVLSLLLGGPTILPDDEIARVVKKFKDYGPKATSDSHG